MIYLTRDNETPASVAYTFSGGSDESLANEIRDINSDSIAAIGGMDGIYAPDRPLWIPSPGDEIGFTEQQHIVRQLDWLSPSERYTLRRLQLQGHDTVALAHAHHLAAKANHITGSTDEDGFFGWLGIKSSEFFGAAAKIKSERLSNFELAVQDVKAKMLNLRDLTEQGLEEMYPQAREAFKDSYRNMSELYNTEMKHFKTNRELLYSYFNDMEHSAVQEGIKIMHTPDMQKVVKFAKYCKYIGKTVFIAGIVDRAYELSEAYKHDGPWIKMLIEDVLEVAAAVLISFIAGLLFVGGGWVVVLGAAAFEVGANIAFDYLVDKEMNT